jgi:hypothetical protein
VAWHGQRVSLFGPPRRRRRRRRGTRCGGRTARPERAHRRQHASRASGRASTSASGGSAGADGAASAGAAAATARPPGIGGTGLGRARRQRQRRIDLRPGRLGRPGITRWSPERVDPRRPADRHRGASDGETSLRRRDRRRLRDRRVCRDPPRFALAPRRSRARPPRAALDCTNPASDGGHHCRGHDGRVGSRCVVAATRAHRPAGSPRPCGRRRREPGAPTRGGGRAGGAASTGWNGSASSSASRSAAGPAAAKTPAAVAARSRRAATAGGGRAAGWPRRPRRRGTPRGELRQDLAHSIATNPRRAAAAPPRWAPDRGRAMSPAAMRLGSHAVGGKRRRDPVEGTTTLGLPGAQRGLSQTAGVRPRPARRRTGDHLLELDAGAGRQAPHCAPSLHRPGRRYGLHHAATVGSGRLQDDVRATPRWRGRRGGAAAVAGRGSGELNAARGGPAVAGAGRGGRDRSRRLLNGAGRRAGGFGRARRQARRRAPVWGSGWSPCQPGTVLSRPHHRTADRRAPVLRGCVRRRGMATA